MKRSPGKPHVQDRTNSKTSSVVPTHSLDNALVTFHVGNQPLPVPKLTAGRASPISPAESPRSLVWPNPSLQCRTYRTENSEAKKAVGATKNNKLWLRYHSKDVVPTK